MEKLSEQSKKMLNAWAFDFHWYDGMDSVLASENSGRISGYLNALVHNGTLELEEAIELYHKYTK